MLQSGPAGSRSGTSGAGDGSSTAGTARSTGCRRRPCESWMIPLATGQSPRPTRGPAASGSGGRAAGGGDLRRLILSLCASPTSRGGSIVTLIRTTPRKCCRESARQLARKDAKERIGGKHLYCAPSASTEGAQVYRRSSNVLQTPVVSSESALAFSACKLA